MNCNEAQGQLPIYADGELDAAQRSALEAHLQRCEPCRSEVARWQALRRCVHRALGSAALPADLRGRVVASLTSQPRMLRLAQLKWLAGVSAAAAILLFAFIVVPRLFGTKPVPPRVSAQPDPNALTVAAGQFSQIYRFCAVEMRHDGRHVRGACPTTEADKLHGELQFVALVPDLSERGFKLDGVCNCLRVAGAKAIHAFYRRESPEVEIVSFFSVDRHCRLKKCSERSGCSNSKNARAYEVATVNTVTVLKWDDADCSYAVCGEMDQARLFDLADSVSVADLNDGGPAFAHNVEP